MNEFRGSEEPDWGCGFAERHTAVSSPYFDRQIDDVYVEGARSSRRNRDLAANVQLRQ